MQASIEASEGFNRKVKVVIPADELKKVEQKTVQYFMKNRRVAGFRPGKVPANVVMSQYGAEINASVADQMIQTTLQKALEQVELKDLANSLPLMNTFTKSAEGEFVYIFDVEVPAVIDLQSNPLSNLEVKKVVASITDADMDKMLEVLCKQQGKWSETDAAADNGNQVVIDFEGFIDGVAFEGGKASGYTMLLGESRMIPGFEDQIKGHKANEEFDINVTFPADYHNADLAGKPAVFKSKISKVSVLKPAELNEDFIKALGTESGNLDEFKVEVRKNMDRELEFNQSKINENEVMSKLLDTYTKDLALPPREVEAFAESFIEDSKKQKREVSKEQATEYATAKLKAMYVSDAVVKALEVKVSEEDVNAEIDTFVSAYDQADMFKESIKKNPQQMNRFREMCFSKVFVKKVFEVAKVTEENKDFFSLVHV